MHRERLKAGAPIFVDRAGRPTLVMKCGNPLVLGPSRARKGNLTTVVPVNDDSTHMVSMLEPRDVPLLESDGQDLLAAVPPIPEIVSRRTRSWGSPSGRSLARQHGTDRDGRRLSIPASRGTSASHPDHRGDRSQRRWRRRSPARPRTCEPSRARSGRGGVRPASAQGLRETRARPRLGLPDDRQPFRRIRVQALTPSFGHGDDILDPHPESPRKVDSRLDAEAVARNERRFAFPRR